MRRLLLIILSSIALLTYSLHVKAQWDSSSTQFWNVKTSFNPSFAGEKEQISTSVLYKQHWAKAKDGPRVMHLSANMPIEFLGLAHGVGIMLSNTNVGQERNSFMAAQYSYKHKVGKGWLNAGIQMGMHDINFDAASYQLKIDSVQNDKSISVNPVDKKRIDFSAGISWTSKRFFVGVGANHINQPNYYSVKVNQNNNDQATNDSTMSKMPISYNLMAGCNIRLFNTLFEIEPMIYARADEVSKDLSAALQLSWNKKYSAGAMWRGDRGYSIFAGATISNVSLRYAFDRNKDIIGRDAGANHEVIVQYSFDLDIFNPKPQPHKSIRLL